MKSFANGEKVREALETLKPGEVILYHNIIHTVIDAGPVQGKRILTIKELDALGHSNGEPCDPRIEDR